VLHVENAEKPTIMPDKDRGQKSISYTHAAKNKKNGIRNAAKTKQKLAYNVVSLG
jgi:hypothetical protein